MSQPATDSGEPLLQSAATGSRMSWFFNGGWNSYQNAQREFELQFRKDRLGHRLQTWLTGLMCIVACMPSTFITIGMAIVGGYYCLRLTNTYRTAWRPFVSPFAVCFFAFALWQMISISWSLNPDHGWNEISKLRWAMFTLAVWPVIDRRSTLIAFLCGGLFLGNLSQVAEEIGRHYGMYNSLVIFTGRNIDWMLDLNRTGGWWHPLAAGSMLVAALGLHLPAAIMGTGKVRVIALAGSIVSLVGIVATGTRGAILAAVVLIVIVVLYAALRVRPSRKTIGMSAVVLGIAACIGMMTIGDRVVIRASNAINEVQRAIESKNYKSDNGARVQMAIWSFEAIKARPFTGIGAGSFEAWSAQQVVAEGGVPSNRLGDDSTKTTVFEHAHNSALHIIVTTGIIGLALALLTVFSALWGAFATLSIQQQGTYAAGPGWALIGMLIVSMTDPIHFNTQTGVLLFLLFALCPAWRPSETQGVHQP